MTDLQGKVTSATRCGGMTINYEWQAIAEHYVKQINAVTSNGGLPHEQAAARAAILGDVLKVIAPNAKELKNIASDMNHPKHGQLSYMLDMLGGLKVDGNPMAGNPLSKLNDFSGKTPVEQLINALDGSPKELGEIQSLGVVPDGTKIAERLTQVPLKISMGALLEKSGEDAYAAGLTSLASYAPPVASRGTATRGKVEPEVVVPPAPAEHKSCHGRG